MARTLMRESHFIMIRQSLKSKANRNVSRKPITSATFELGIVLIFQVVVAKTTPSFSVEPSLHVFENVLRFLNFVQHVELDLESEVELDQDS